MSAVSALISRFSSMTDSPPPSPGSGSGGGDSQRIGSSVNRRHYSTGSAGSSRSESPASSDAHSPHPEGNNGAVNPLSDSVTPRSRVLSSITEDRIRMFNSQCADGAKEGTDGPPCGRSSPRVKRVVASRQMSAGCVDGREGEGLKVPGPRRQLSAPVVGRPGGRSPSPFRLPGMASSSQFSDDVQETDIEEAIDSLQSDDPTLTELNLNNHTRLDTETITELLEALGGNTHLQNLSMANVRFNEDHAKCLADVLRTNTSLTVLNLESNRITRKGIAAMMKALAENKQTALSELRLANQYFAGGAGAEADIAKHLEKITSIIRLGYNFTSPSLRTRIDGYIMRNTDRIRQKRASYTA